LTKLTYFGHSTFMLEDGEHTVLIDPFMSGNPVCDTAPESVSPDTILLTHAHGDHVGDTIDIAKRTGAKVIATFELATWLGSQGVENAVGGNHGGTIAFPGGTAKFTIAWHTSSYELPDGTFTAPGVPAGFVIRFGGKTIYAAGDTALFLDMKLIGDEGLDLALLPIGDHFTMGPDDALKAVEFLRPTAVIPCHYNTFSAIEQDVDRFKARVESETKAKVLAIAPGGCVNLDEIQAHDGAR
jgi:L-ascorbate metabolism protein UlaG (beta-lactamase superfamily)